MNKKTPFRIRDDLERDAREMGGAFFGVADLSPAREAILDQGGAFVSSFPRALSVGIPLYDGIVDELPRHREAPVAKTYDYLYYTVNRALDAIALRLGMILNREGGKSLMIPASDRVDEKRVLGIFSHKMAANLAGLGWIGPSCLLVTPEIGPRVRWVTVLTDVPLEAGTPLENRCGDCRKCVDACPPKAFTGRPFHPEEPRELRFDVRRCEDYRYHLRDKVTGARVCGMCVHVCPFGMKG